MGAGASGVTYRAAFGLAAAIDARECGAWRSDASGSGKT